MDRNFIHSKENTLLKLYLNHPEYVGEPSLHNPNYPISICKTTKDICSYCVGNDNASWEEIEANLDEIRSIYSSIVDVLCDHPSVTLDVIERVPEFLNSPHKSLNQNLTLEFVQKHLDTPWDWDQLKYRRFITKEFLDIVRARFNITISEPHYSGRYRYDSTLTWDVILRDLRYNWNWRTISAHDNITLNIIKAHPDMPWVWASVSRNVNITWELILANPDLPWDIRAFSGNPNLTYDVIVSMLDVWDMDMLQTNEYGYNTTKYIRDIRAYRVRRRASFKKLMYAHVHPAACINVIKTVQDFM
jgi:hypothetical protein